MVKIFNPTVGPSPLAQTLQSLGKQLFGDRTANEINSEKLYELRRKNAETDNLMRQVGTTGVRNLASDPIAQARLIGSEYDPADFGKIGLLDAATAFGAKDSRTQNFQVGTGQGYDNTYGAFATKAAETARNNNMQSADRRYGVDQSQATERYKFENEPKAAIAPNGAPSFVPQNELTRGSYSPILSESDQKGVLLSQNFDNLPALNPNQQEVLGARVTPGSSTPRNYVMPTGKSFITYDGVTDAQSGQPLPPGGFIGNVEGGAGDVGLTNSTMSGLQQSNVALDKFMAVANMAEPLTQDPTLFGPQGFIRSKAQDILQSIGGIQEVDNTRQRLESEIGPDAARALIPEFYDPRLSEVEALWGILLYQGASALAGQENRSVSDKDIGMMRAILGDPHSLFASNLSMKTKLDVAKKLVNAQAGVNQKYLGGAPAGDGAAAPGAAAQPRIRRYNPQTGQLE